MNHSPQGLPPDFKDLFFPTEYMISSNNENYTILSGFGSNIELIPELKREPGLFDEIEESMKGKEPKPSLDDNLIQDVRSILALIYNTFASRSNNLNCFLYQGDKNNRRAVQLISGLPIFRLSLLKDGTSTISFSADWNGEKRQYEGWDELPLNELPGKKTLYKARLVFLIPDVKTIHLYDWGFEIEGSSMNFIAALSYAIVEPEQSLARIPWTVPLKSEYTGSYLSQPPIASWNKEVEIKKDKNEKRD